MPTPRDARGRERTLGTKLLSAYVGVGIEISYFYYKDIKNIQISAQMSINVFPPTYHLHTLKGKSRKFRVMKVQGSFISHYLHKVNIERKV